MVLPTPPGRLGQRAQGVLPPAHGCDGAGGVELAGPRRLPRFLGVAQNLVGGANRRFWSMFPLTRVLFWHRFFEPQPCVTARVSLFDQPQ